MEPRTMVGWDALKKRVATQSRAGRGHQWTLGQLIDALAAVEDQAANVWYDFPGQAPTTLGSWRGSYDELAIGYIASDKGKDAPTVAELLARCRQADGAVMTGWKGGDYLMDRQTPVWVANRGESSDCAIVGLRNLGWSVVIETAFCEY